MSQEKLNVLILGYGAREHALAWKIAQSPLVGEIFVAPGNAGTAQIATNVSISDEDVHSLVPFALANKIGLTVVGTNDPLALGVVDAFEAAGLKIFGPNQAAARLESSKAFAKSFMQRHNIQTPAYEVFHNYHNALTYLNLLPTEKVVVKVSGLGKMGMGVTVCDNKEQAKQALADYMLHKTLGDEAAQTIIIEERISGSEISMFALSDGKNVVPLLPIRDHKQIYDHDQGPNTGGMGAYAPPPDLTPQFVDDVMHNIIEPTIHGMAEEGNPYVGVLYAGLMLTDAGIQVLEFNCRFGNPEALVLMALLESDLVEIMLACIDGALTKELIHVRQESAVAVVMASPNYPAESFLTGLPIYGVEQAEKTGVQIFHHGTSQRNGKLVTSRGRVLAVTATGNDLQRARMHVYEGIQHISFAGAHYRKDVGQMANISELHHHQYEPIASVLANM